MKKINTMVNLDEDVLKAAKEFKSTNGVPVSVLINMLLKAWVERKMIKS